MDVGSVSTAELIRLFKNDTDLIDSYIWSDQYDDHERDEMESNHTWLIAAYLILLIVGLISNIWVICVISFSLHQSRHSADAPRAIQIFILSLCTCDLIVLPFLIFLITDLVYGQWVLPFWTGVCTIYLCSETLNKFCAPFLLVVLSGYCFVNLNVNQRSKFRNFIEHSKLGRKSNVTFTGSKWCVLAIGVCLMLVLILMTPVYMFGNVHFIIVYNQSEIYSVTPKCSFQPPENISKSFVVYSFVCGYVIPAFLFTFFYACILHRAWDQTRKRSRTLSVRGNNDSLIKSEQNTSQSRLNLNGNRGKSYLSRVVKTTLGLVLFYLCCWTPYWVMNIYQYLTPWTSMQEHSNSAFVMIGYLVHMLPYINCTGYPILYTAMNNSIKDAYRRSIKLKKTRRKLRNWQSEPLSRTVSNRNACYSTAGIESDYGTNERRLTQ